MGFYGSVYYQLVDTFYKVAVKNTGAERTSFLTSVDANEELSSQAVGRKGVFGLASGNRWINFDKATAPDGSAIYQIWHGMPNPTPAGNPQASGFVLLNKDSLSEEEKKNAQPILYADYFKTHEVKYDEAGHIVSAEEKLYQFPQDVINNDVIILKGQIGTAEEGRSDEDRDGNKLETLYGYAEDNYDNIKELQSYVGDLKTIADYWGHDWAIGELTLAQIIGDLDLMLSDQSLGGGVPYLTKENFKSLSTVIGNVLDMYRALDPDEKKNPKERSLCEALTFIYEELTSFISTTYTEKMKGLDGQIATINIVLAEHDEDIKDIEGDIVEIRETHTTGLKNLDDKHTNDINAEAVARGEADNALDKKINDEAKARSDEDIAINAKILSLQEEDGKIRTAYANADKAIEEAQAGVNSAIRSEYANGDNTVRSEFQSADTALKTELQGNIDAVNKALDDYKTEQSGINTSLMQGYEAGDKALSDSLSEFINTTYSQRCTTIEQTATKDREDAAQALTDFKTNVVGDISDDTNVMAEIAKANSNIEDNSNNITVLSTNLGETLHADTSAFQEIQNIYTQIGTEALGENISITKAIVTNQGNINTANATINSVSGELTTAKGNIATIMDDISTINGNISTINDTISGHGSQIGTLTGEVGKLQNSYDSLDKTVKENHEDVEQSLQTLNGLITTLESNDVTFNKNLNELAQTSSEHSAGLIGINKECKQNREAIEVLEVKGQDMANNLSQYSQNTESKIQELEKTIASLQETVKNLENTIATLHPDDSTPPDSPDNGEVE